MFLAGLCKVVLVVLIIGVVCVWWFGNEILYVPYLGIVIVGGVFQFECKGSAIPGVPPETVLLVGWVAKCSA